MTATASLRFVLGIVLAGVLGSAAAQEQKGEPHDAKGVLRLLPADAITEH